MTETYDRTASSSSIFRRVLEAQAPTIEAELTSKAIKYTGSGSKSAAKMEFSPNGVTIRLWLDMRFQEGQSDPREDEVRELAELFLGKDSSLIQAYIDEVIEDLDGEPRDLSPQERDHWLEREVGVLLKSEDVEKALLKTYTTTYLAKVPWAKYDDALAVFDHPSGFPDRFIPRKVVEAVGRQIALQDAAEAQALRDLALSRSQPSH